MLMLTQLIGFGGAEVVAAPPAAMTLAFVNSNHSEDSGSITCPACSAGDILLFWDIARDLGTPSDVIPTGFTRIGTTLLDTGRRTNLSYKLAAGTEGGTNLGGMGAASEGNSKIVMVYRGTPAAVAISVQDVEQQITAANPAVQTVTCAAGVTPLLVVGAYFSDGIEVNPRTFSPTQDQEVASLGAATIGYLDVKIYNTAPANTTIDMDDEGNRNALYSAFLEVS